MKSIFRLSKTILITSVLSCASVLVAAEKTSKKPEAAPPPPLVTLGNSNYHFEASFTALVMQPYANNLDYAAEALPFNYGNTYPAVSPSWVIPEISTDYHFGFDAKIVGMIHSANSSLMLNWERYHSPNDSSSLTVNSTNNMVGTFFEIGPDASVYKKGTGTVSFHFDEVNLDYGTFVQFGRLLRMNLFAGAGYARLVQNRFTTISDLPGTVIRTLSVPAKFQGAGPQLGFDFGYTIVKGLQFVGNTRASLFVGTFKNSTRYTTQSAALASTGNQNPNVQTTTVYNKGGVVPGFEGKLGLAYEVSYCGNYMIKLEAGYQAQVYVNAIRSTDMGSEVALAAAGSVGSSTFGVYARTFDRTVSDFALAGPYATIDFGF
jgi:hypothetical protein